MLNAEQSRPLKRSLRDGFLLASGFWLLASFPNSFSMEEIPIPGGQNG